MMSPFSSMVKHHAARGVSVRITEVEDGYQKGRFQRRGRYAESNTNGYLIGFNKYGDTVFEKILTKEQRLFDLFEKKGKIYARERKKKQQDSLRGGL